VEAKDVPASQLILRNLLKRIFDQLAGLRGSDQKQCASLLRDGSQLQSAGDEAGAEKMYRRALERQPRSADAQLQLGSLLGKLNRTDEALNHLTRAIDTKPDFAQAHVALGNIYLLTGNFAAAHVSYAKAMRLDSSNPALFFNLGLLFQRQLDHKSALENFERAYALLPDMPGLIRNLTLERIELGQYERSESHLMELNARHPNDPEVLFSLGHTLQNMHRPELAIQYFERARAQGKADAELLLNLGIVLRDLGRIDEAVECHNAALEIRPGFEPALWHRSLEYLLQYDFARGWEHYDLRLRSKDRPQRPPTYPEWNGGEPAALRVLIYGEQGIGDEIMFASCLPQMIAKSRHCVVECSGKLVALFQHSFPDAIVRSSPAPVRSNIELDVQIAMGSLPQHLRKSRDDFPRHHGYLRADSTRIEAWRERLAAIGRGPKVGISWRGGTYKTRSAERSIPLEQWAPILGTDSVHFVDLQYSDCGNEVDAAEERCGLRIHRWSEARQDFDETAALVSALDLVVSVCTAVIHLGGALGRPVWVMAPHSPEWRYGIRGDSMPWYPSVRMFRQPSRGAWGPVIGDVAQSLQNLRDDVFVAPD
jgi:tetratricopeptide (TPR) repeat protein